MEGEIEKCDSKTQLVIQICNLSTACNHKLPFIDWYLVLQVEENADLDLMRKQYRKLALQLHPDKNKHPKAEIAFKLLTEAYACLSNNARRVIFNLERRNSQCFECKRIKNDNKAFTGPLSPEKTNSQKYMQNLINLRERFSEEAKVIQNCLKVTSESKRRNSSKQKNEYPIFNPTDYLCMSYPHQRTKINKTFEDFQSLWKFNLLSYGHL